VQFKILLVVEGEDILPTRVNTTASTMQELLYILVEESTLGLPDPNRYDIKLWDEEFGTYIRFPKTLADVPTKCKVSIRKLPKAPKVESTLNGTSGSSEVQAKGISETSAANANVTAPTLVHNDTQNNSVAVSAASEVAPATGEANASEVHNQ